MSVWSLGGANRVPVDFVAGALASEDDVCIRSGRFGAISHQCGCGDSRGYVVRGGGIVALDCLRELVFGREC